MVGCTKEDFRGGMINTYKDRAVFWLDSYTPVLDVTGRVHSVKPFIIKAFLVIRSGDTDKIEVIGPYDSPPTKYPDGRDLTDENVVQNWQNGEELERQKCARDNKYYWVKYPCQLITIPPDISALFPSNNKATKTVTRRGRIF